MCCLENVKNFYGQTNNKESKYKIQNSTIINLWINLYFTFILNIIINSIEKQKEDEF